MKSIADAVRHRAKQRCEYCLLPQGAFQRLFQLEHITARQHGGLFELDNLALACRPCNQKKGPNLAGIDPMTKNLTPLYNPRTHSWIEHFAVVLRHAPTFRLEIQGVTAVGRTTAYVLGFNEGVMPSFRYLLNEDSEYRWPG
jgi:hypothetical protein